MINKNDQIKIIEHYDLPLDKDFIEVWIGHNQVMDISKEENELILTVFSDNKTLCSIPISVLEKAIKAAKEFIDD